jgi:hypothetical protein
MSSQATSRNAEKEKAPEKEKAKEPAKRDKADSLKAAGGLIAVSAGLLTLLVIATLALVFVRNETAQVATIASAAFGVVGTVVGAYFGVKAGTDQSEKAQNQTQGTVQALREEAAKAQAFAAHVPENKTTQALDEARRMAGQAEVRVPGSSSGQA